VVQMTKVVVEAGSCGFKVIIEVIKVSARGVKIRLTSDCEMVNEMNRQLQELDWQDTLRGHLRIHRSIILPWNISTPPVPFPWPSSRQLRSRWEPPHLKT
jgi:hypothetical protein